MCVCVWVCADPQGNKIPPPSNLALFYRASPNEQVQLECIGAGTNIIVSWSHNGVDLSQNTSSITVQGADTRGVYCCRLRSSGRTSDLLTSYCTYILPQSEPHTCVYVRMYIQMYPVTYVHTYVHTVLYVCIYVHTYMCICMCIHTYICIIRKMVCICTLMHTSLSSRLDRYYLFQNPCTKPTVPVMVLIYSKYKEYNT